MRSSPKMSRKTGLDQAEEQSPMFAYGTYFLVLFSFLVVVICVLAGYGPDLTLNRKSLKLGGSAPLRHVRIYTDSDFATQLAGATSALVTSPAGTTAYSLPANAVISHAVITTTAALTGGAGATVELGTAADATTASANILGATIVANFGATGNIFQPTPLGRSAIANAGAVTATVRVADLTAGALTVDLFYYAY